jgi:hypothetical protein
MDLRYYFVLGSKLIGLYCLVLALIYFVPIIPSFFVKTIYQQEEAGYYRIIYLAFILTPIFLAGLGLYLIRDGGFIHDLAFPAKGATFTVEMEHLFTLGIKLYGVFLAASSIPHLLKLLANYIFVFNQPYDFSRTVADNMGFKTDFLPELVSIILGVYFVLRGETITRLAFWKRRDSDSQE